MGAGACVCVYVNEMIGINMNVMNIGQDVVELFGVFGIECMAHKRSRARECAS